ncbi:MAG: hypothetical protein QOC94_1722 [Actinoplanes sp.]|jgi:hypothetical protein|nr:hypothetical protein [Actinoplanes sp.]
MSARKLSRLAGLVFVLAALFGGVGAAAAVAEHEAGGPSAVEALIQSKIAGDIVWG